MVIYGEGSHFETLAWIQKSHNSTTKKTLVFQYKHGKRLIDIYKSWIKKYNFEISRPDVDTIGNGKTDGYLKITLSCWCLL